MKPFDLQTAPLKGGTLIEAGAGTGKTYALVGLFLRMIVELGLRIEQILVVTYTKAATEELKTRIRNRLTAARNAFGGGPVDDDALASMVHTAPDIKEALQRIETALTDFDRAAIFTIHGFCQRLLQQYAFETGHLFQSDLVQDRRIMVREMVEDFWRRYISSAPYELAHFALHQLKGPDQLSKVLQLCAYPLVRVLPKTEKPRLSSIRGWRREADALLRQWAADKARILNLLLDPGMHARFYGKCEASALQPTKTYRQLRLAEFSAAIDQWNGKYPLDDKSVKYLRSSLIAKYTKKGHAIPGHAFFDTCERALAGQEQMVGQMASYLCYLKARLVRQTHQLLDQKKRSRNILFFDDLLLKVHAALAGKQGYVLSQTVRSQYCAALVDEFQDTDPLQYEIFQRLFSRPPHILFMIGDPKQAIYSFRGADLFSYLKASEDVQSRTTLDRNWRATPTLVKAVNTLFENHAHPFGFKNINFTPAVAADEKMKGAQWPLKLWYLTNTSADENAKPVNQADAGHAIVAAVAQEIVRLLSDPRNDLEPRQIAVLTRTHRQSQTIKDALVHRKVPAVLHSAGSIFDTREAEAMARLLAAVAEPNNPKKIRAALLDPIFDLYATDFHLGMENPGKQWQDRWSAFHHDHQTWIRYGVYAMLRGLMVRQKAKVKLLCLPDGERRITNVLHLAELLHQAENEHHLGPEALVHWLDFQRQSPDDSDENQLRLESDARAVRIVTMHKSKGLQFDVVFCPFTWGGVRMSKDGVVFHDAAYHDRLTISLGGNVSMEHQLQARKELFSENLRMLYVALTRAKYRCYMIWGRIHGAELSAPAYLLHGSQMELTDGDWLSPLERRMKALTEDDMVQELQQLAKRSMDSIEVEPLPASTNMVCRTDGVAQTPGPHRVLRREIADIWRMASFSSLTAGLSHEQNEWPDRDFNNASSVESEEAAAKYDCLLDFPKGAHAGLFFHDLLENWDHTGKDPSGQIDLVRGKLVAHGFQLQWLPLINRFLDHLATKVLSTPTTDFALSQVPPDHRVNEMEFHFALKHFASAQLRNCFVQHDSHQLGGSVVRQLDRLTFAPMQGFMKGFMDTVFQHGQQYYLVDWKSNHLGRDPDDYGVDNLAQSMVEDYYFLQYHLYTVALNRLLQQKVNGYDYDRHFGGVFYIFLRGIDENPSGDTGVFYAKPGVSLIRALDELMMATG